jgi:hypothetical protein
VNAIGDRQLLDIVSIAISASIAEPESFTVRPARMSLVSRVVALTVWTGRRHDIFGLSVL